NQFLGIVITVIVLSLLFGGIIGTYLGAQSKTMEGITFKIRVFMKIIKTVENDYFRKVEVEELLDYAIRGMLRSLDPHTIYLDRDEFNELIVGTKGSFGGLGIQIGIRDDILTIITPLEGTPAYNAGLLAGDKIVEIEKVSTKGITLQQAVKKLRGKPGTEVTIGIKREEVKDVTHFTITRDIIKVKAVPYSGMVSDGIGYIRLSSFSEVSPGEFANAIDSLLNEGANKFIVDLRNNSGGLLKAAIDISDNFIDKGKIILSTKGRKIGTSRDYYAKRHPKYGDFPLVILVNGGSASASEIVSIAIQDWDRGLILGTKTFGKGSVQQVIPIDHETALKITTALYYSPSGRSIDIEIKKKEQSKSTDWVIEKEEIKALDKREIDEIKEKIEDKKKEKKNGEIKEDTTTYYTLRLKRKVYGGGAVTPDIVLELPKMTEFETKIYQKALFFSFTVDYTAEHKIKKGFSVEEKMLSSFKDYIKNKNIEFTDEDFEKSIDDLKIGLKRNISMKLWGIKSSYESVIMDDRQVAKAIEILEKSKNIDDMFTLIEE
ncbi:MAG: S41 family peptidase, partial [Candidatus Cloacimonadota bacterium]